MLTHFFKNIGPISADFVFLGTIFLLFFIYGVYVGKSRMVSMILSFYPSAFLYQHFPYLNKLLFLKGDTLITLNKIGIFLLFFVPINILIARYSFSEYSDGSKHYFRIAGFALAGTILLAVFSFQFISLNLLYSFSQGTINIFTASNNLFWFSIAPLAILLFL